MQLGMSCSTLPQAAIGKKQRREAGDSSLGSPAVDLLPCAVKRDGLHEIMSAAGPGLPNAVEPTTMDKPLARE
jgi:hypothetical protein